MKRVLLHRGLRSFFMMAMSVLMSFSYAKAQNIITVYMYDMDWNEVDWGTVSGNEGTFANGDVVTLTVTPISGKEVREWYNSDFDMIAGETNTCDVVVDGNTEVYVFMGEATIRHNLYVNVYPEECRNLCSVTGDGEKLDGATPTLTASYADPYTIDHWEIGGVQVKGNSSTYTLEPMHSDVTVDAIFAYIPQERTISVATNDANLGTVQIASGSEQSNTSLNVYEGEQITLTATPVGNNAVFAGWYLAANKVSEELSYTFTLPNGSGDREYLATFVSQEQNFTMLAQCVRCEGGAVSPNTATTVQGGSQQTFSVTSITSGWEFDGWYDDDIKTNLVSTATSFTVNPVIEDVTLYAHFHHQPYTITTHVNPANSGSVTVSAPNNQGTYDEFTDHTVTATANTGYRFGSWTGINQAGESFTITSINHNYDITANFIKTWQVNVSATQGAAPTVQANTTPHNGWYDEGTTVIVTAGDVDGYAFTYWTVDGVDNTSATNKVYNIQSLSSTVTLRANYVPLYRVRLYKNPTNVTATLNGADNYAQGTTASVSVDYDDNVYTFNGWSYYPSTNIITTDNPFEFTVNSNVDLTANFTTNTVYYNVTVNVEGTGCSVSSEQIPNIVSGVANQVEEGRYITLVPNDFGDYHFVRWEIGNGVYPAAQYPTYSTQVNSDLTITAVFEEANVYHVTFLTDPENDPIIEFIGVNPNGIYNEGEALDVTVTAHGNPNYEFVAWFKDGRLYRQARTEHLQIAHVTSDMEFTAVYDVFESEDIDYLVYDDEVAKTTIIGVQDAYRTNISTVNIPASVTAIADQAFAGCTSLSSLVIPDNVQTIGNYAFSNCSALSTIILPDGISLGTYVFNNCRSLRNVMLPADMTAIPEGLFYGCNDLSSMEIPATVESVGSFAFYGCRNIYTLTVPASVTTIGAQSFASMNGLHFVNLAAGIESIGSNAFEGSTRIVLTNFEGTMAEWLAISFENENSQPVSRSRNLAINGELVTELNVPAGITEIKSYAFYGDTLITEITMPADVTTIGDKAFYHLKNLERITLHSLPANVSDNAFEGVSADVIVAVPCGMETQARTQQWGGFTNFVTDGMPVLTLVQRPGGTVTIEEYPSCNDAEYTYQILANNGLNYQFLSWSDGNTEQSRSITLTEDMTLSPIWLRVESAETMTPTYSCAFENSQEKSAWFVVAPGVNKWNIGNAVHYHSVLGGTKSLYVTTNENGNNNEYDDEGQSTYVFSDVYMYEGINEISFYYRVAGNEGDYMNVAILPDEMNYEELNPYSNGAILVADNLYGDGDTWQYEARMVNIVSSGWRKVAFFWNVTDDNNSTDIAAAVDNLNVLYRNPNNLSNSFVDVDVEVAAASDGMGTAYTGETPGVTSKRYYYGDDITIHAVPADNEHQFVQWMIGDRVISTEADYTLDFVEYWGINPTLTAVFELIPTTYTVTVTLQEGADNSSAEYGVMDANGDINAVTAIDNSQDADLYLNLPQEGWAFLGWANEAGDIVATDNPFTYTGRVNAHFIAVMKEYHDCSNYDDPNYYNPFNYGQQDEPISDHDTPEMRDVIVSNINVFMEGKQIVVENTGDYTVTLYDVSGRALDRRVSPDQKIYFDVPLSGSYLIRVGNVLTQRVVVVK